MYAFSVQALEVQGNPKPKTPYEGSDSSSAQLPNFQIGKHLSTLPFSLRERISMSQNNPIEVTLTCLP